MASVEQAVATFERNIEAQTGLSVGAWVERLRAAGLERHGQMVAWLKAEHGLGHGHANHLAKRTREAAAPRDAEDGVAHLFVGAKSGLRPLYDDVVAAAVALGADVEIAPKKLNVSLRRRKQFGLIQPSTATRLDLGLVLPGVTPVGRMEAAGSFNAMVSHRVRLGAPDDLDAEVLAMLRAAYDLAG